MSMKKEVADQIAQLEFEIREKEQQIKKLRQSTAETCQHDWRNYPRGDHLMKDFRNPGNNWMVKWCHNCDTTKNNPNHRFYDDY